MTDVTTPDHIARQLDVIGVVASPKPAPEPRLHTPAWRPEYPGQEPPF